MLFYRRLPVDIIKMIVTKANVYFAAIDVREGHKPGQYLVEYYCESGC